MYSCCWLYQWKNKCVIMCYKHTYGLMYMVNIKYGVVFVCSVRQLAYTRLNSYVRIRIRLYILYMYRLQSKQTKWFKNDT